MLIYVNCILKIECINMYGTLNCDYLFYNYSLLYINNRSFISIIMVRPVKTVNKIVCPDCNTEFTGKTCPECGTTAKLKPLASDGIPRDMHKTDVIFGDVSQLSTSNELLNDDAELLKERAEYQKAETHDNLRESLVLKSKIKNMELEKEMLQKKIELDRYHMDPVSPQTKDWPVVYPANQQQQEQPAQQQQSLFGPVSPQASFMSQLMKMDKDKRGDFLEQLTDADPNALQTLSGMFQQNSTMNPNSNQMMNPNAMNMQYPPWMYSMLQQQQQQPQSQEPAQDPMVGAVTMMGEMFEIFKSMQPKTDNTANDKINDLKGALEKMNDKLDSKLTEKSQDVNESLRAELHDIKSTISNSTQDNSLSNSVHQMKNIITDLESLGLVNNPISHDQTVDEQLKLQEASHKIEMDNKKFDLEKNQLDTNTREADTKRDIVSALMKGRMQRRFSDTVNDTQLSAQPPIKQMNQIRRQNIKPKEVYSEIKTDAGIVQETKKVVPTE